MVRGLINLDFQPSPAEAAECPLCLKDMAMWPGTAIIKTEVETKGAWVMRTERRHYFHRECLRVWIQAAQGQPSCPMCRR